MQPRSVKKSVWAKFLLCFQLRIWFLNAVCNAETQNCASKCSLRVNIPNSSVVFFFFPQCKTSVQRVLCILHWVTAVFDLIRTSLWIQSLEYCLLNCTAQDTYWGHIFLQIFSIHSLWYLFALRGSAGEAGGGLLQHLGMVLHLSSNKKYA